MPTWTRLAALLPNWKFIIDCFICTAEDNMNVQLKDITVTARDGRVSHLDQVYIRGSHVRFFIVPDMLRYAEGPVRLSIDFNSQDNVIPGEWQLTSLFFRIGTLPCSAHEVSVGAVSVWRVVGLQCSGRVASGGVEFEREVDMNCVNELEVWYKAGLTEWLAFLLVFIFWSFSWENFRRSSVLLRLGYWHSSARTLYLSTHEWPPVISRG